MTRPGHVRIENADGATAFVKDKVAHIRSDVDARFRNALRKAVHADGGKTARNLIMKALEQGPSRGGAVEAMRYFGPELQTKLVLTAQIIDGLEISVNGFKKWLELTGFGNDVTMIKAFVAWAEFKNGAGRVIPGVKRAFDA